MTAIKNFTVADMVNAANGKFVGDEAVLTKPFTTAVIDSRQAVEGSVFFALKGEKTDGYNYIPSAAEKGALCSVCEKPYEGYNCIVVEDAQTALQDIARAYRHTLNITVIGITGSVGKTTTKELVANVLSQKYTVTKTEGNFNNGLGLPLTVLSITPETEVAVIEMGMNHFDEMRLLSSIAVPTMCIITNIGISHIENFGTRENIYLAKSEIFEHMSSTARCIVNGDDDLLKDCERPNKCLYGFSDSNNIYVEKFCEQGFDGTDFTVSLYGEKIDFHINVPGRHVLFAAMAAMAAGSWLGLTNDEIAQGISTAGTISGRLNIIKTDKYTLIDDCYNAAPQSMESAIDILSRCRAKRTICILGDMGELGDDEVILHMNVGAHAAKSKIGLLIAIGSLSLHTYEGCLKNGGNAMWFPTKEDFFAQASEILKDEDVILIKASHFMEFSKIVNFLS